MAPFPRWADLQPELLCCIGDHLDLKSYTSARGACTTWRRALEPQSPTLLMIADDHDRRVDAHHSWCPYAVSLRTRRSFSLAAIVAGARCVGSSTDGWLALSVGASRCHTVFVLLNPVAAVEILLPPLVYESHRWVASTVSKVVFSPSPAKDDFAAAAICDGDRIAYVTAGARRWAVMDPVRLTASGDFLVDAVYADQGIVYCLTMRGHVHVVRLPERRRRNPAANVVDEAGVPSLDPKFSLLQPPQSSSQREVNSWMRHYGLARTRDHDPTLWFYNDRHEETLIRSVSSELEQPHLNAPATVEPLLCEANLPFNFNPATAFAPPYGIVSSFTGAKNLVFCEGLLYQVWRNKSCTVTMNLPARGRRRLVENEILVFRYYPRRQPCWDVVKELGGYSVFLGRNNAVSMYAEGVPGLKGNCVYWIGGSGRDQGLVFDMESRRSTPCEVPPPVGFLPGHPHSAICWYFLSHVCNEHQQQQLQQ